MIARASASALRTCMTMGLPSSTASTSCNEVAPACHHQHMPTRPRAATHLRLKDRTLNIPGGMVVVVVQPNLRTQRHGPQARY